MDIRSIRGLRRGNARTRGLVAAMAVAGLLTLAGPALAVLPQNHVVTHGQVVPEVVGNAMTIRQTSQAAKLDWTSFDIGKDHAVRIEQPNREAFIVNRVTGTTRSQIDGSLTANGRVYLVNPNGVVFGEHAKVDVGGLIAAGKTLEDAQLVGEVEPQLTSNGATGDIEHSGLIVVREGGVARLVGGEVNLRAGSRVRASRADVMLEADANRQDGGSVRMEKGAAVHAFGGEVRIHSGSDLTLGNIRTHDLWIDGRPRKGRYRAKSKAYDGTRRGDIEEGSEISGIAFTDDSTLAPAFEFGGIVPGRQYLFPRVEFRDWLGRVGVSGTSGDFRDRATATIFLPRDELERERIDLPQHDKTLVGDLTVGTPVDKTLTITQRDDYALVDWRTFNVAQDHVVRIEQKSAQSLLVNRVTEEASRIHGRIDANGSVFLINPRGITFGPTAQVDVGTLLAAGRSPVDAVAKRGLATGDSWTFGSLDPGMPAGDVINEGTIRVGDNGVVSLLGAAQVLQKGLIQGGDVDLVRAQVAIVQRNARVLNPGTTRTTSLAAGVAHTGRTKALNGVRIWEGMSGQVNIGGDIATGESGTLNLMAPMGASLNGRMDVGTLAVEAPLTLRFIAQDKLYDATKAASVTDQAIDGLVLGEGSELELLTRYEFDSPEVGAARIVSPELAIRGFNGDAESPLKVTVDPRSITTAQIRPRVLPELDKVRVGKDEYAISSMPRTTTITQTTPYLWLDWLSFDIAKDHSVVFKQERPDWLAVNRVTSARPTVIEGSLRADGRVYLLNPNGITFGATAKVDVGGLVAAAMRASDDQLMDGPARLTLAGIGSAEVANQGEIKIAKGGVATLAAPGVVAQSGLVTAPEGAIHLASTELMTIDDQGKVAQAAGERREVKHSGVTCANDGEVRIYGGKRDVIDGVVEAKGRGRIELAGTGRDWNLGGVIRPGASLLLSEVVSRFGQPAPGALSSQLAQWLNAGTDVEIRTEEDFSVAGPIQTKPDAVGRLTLSGNGAYHLFNRIEVPRLTVQMPLRVTFDARSKNFDGSTRSEVDGLSLLPIIVNAKSNLSLIPSFDFDSPDPGERLVSAKVFLTGYHGDEKHELRVIHDESPEGLRRRTATILPRVDPVPMPDPDGKPGPEPIPIPEPQPRPTPEPEPVVPVVPPPVPEPVAPAVKPAPQPEPVKPTPPPEPVKPTPPPEPVVPAVKPGPQPEPVLPAAKRASRFVDPGCIVDRDEPQPPGRLCEERRSDGPPDRAAAVLSRGIRLNEGSPSSPKHAP